MIFTTKLTKHVPAYHRKTDFCRLEILTFTLDAITNSGLKEERAMKIPTTTTNKRLPPRKKTLNNFGKRGGRPRAVENHHKLFGGKKKQKTQLALRPKDRAT